MSDQPAGVLLVRPSNVAPFRAAQWNGEDPNYDVEWMAGQFGWVVRYFDTHLLINARNNKRHRVRSGEWIIAVGTNGSVRIVPNKQFHDEYEQAQ